ncbi:MAG: hypothetical protein ACU84J_05995 [Gammaproteobacteria bacterium]
MPEFIERAYRLPGNIARRNTGKDDLNLMWFDSADPDHDHNNGGAGDPNNLAGFSNFYYWSSTEKDLERAWNQLFRDGLAGSDDKVNAMGVRAIRAF